MTLTSLSLEQAPPISVPFRFFICAPLFLLLAGSALLVAGPETLASRWSPALLSITHLLTLGCMSMVMCGAMLQMLPVLAGSPVPNSRLAAWAIHPPLIAGTLLLSSGLYFSIPKLLLLAMPLLAFAFAAFLCIAIYSLARAPARNASTHAMALALAALSLTIGLGLLLATGMIGLLDLPMLPLIALHVNWGLLGWTTLLVMGVTYQVVPMFQLTPLFPRTVTRWLVSILFALLLLWSCHLLLPEPAASIFSLITASGLAACITAFAAITLRLQHKRRRRVPDISMQFWRIGMLSLLTASLLWMAGQISTTLADSTFFSLALGILFIIGFALSVIQGMLYKIVPFLVWFHLQSKLPSKQVPNMKSIISDHAARRHLYAHLATLLLCLASAMWPMPWIYAAGSALLLSGILLLANILRAWNCYSNFCVKLQ